MTLDRFGVVALAALVVLAGCAGGVPGAPATDTAETTDTGTTAEPAAGTGSGGVVNFYVSDRPNAIDDFRHLNVAITRVGFHYAGNDSADGRWIEREVDNRSVDLTRLRGDNATLLSSFDVPTGTYDKVFVYVGGVDATLTNGEDQRVKLPSGKLQINKPFEVEPNSSVDFVFDIAIHKAGKSGKYILRPVIGESGTDVPIEDVDEDESDLSAAFVGNVTRGENATVEVTRNGTPVGNATLAIDDETVGTTGADGRATFAVPENVTELEIEITAGGEETELEVEFEEDEERDESERDEDEGEDRDGEENADELSVEFLGTVEPGTNATLQVTRNGTPVGNATVTLDGETVGTTGADGRLTVAIPDAESIEVTATAGDDEAELEIEFEDRGNE